MRRLLQSIIYNRKLYDRPQDEWVCGRAEEGCPCVFGPDAKGQCRATSQCLPAKKGDRWFCTRAISLGAACERGPLPDGSCGCPVPPCWPRRSLRARRSRLTWLVATFALGVSLLVLWGRSRADWSNPGPLTAQHAMSAQHCSDCHVEQVQPALTNAARADRHQQHNQLCLKCHDLGPQGTAPHGATAAQLAALATGPKTGPGTQPLELVAAKAMMPHGPGDLACAACHQEHHGRDFNLSRMGDQQCQVCHQTQFANFTTGHPEFTDYPYVRRTRLQFDHVTHWQKHFADPRLAASAPTSCAHCHEPAIDGRQMLVRNFEQTCAKCHAGQIEGENRAGAKGLVFLRLPGFDVQALEAAGAAVGEWPAYCEGPITPFMRWMLEGDPAARAALATLGSANLSDLTAATPAQKAAAARLLWSVKGLLADLVTQGQQVILRRLGPPVSAQDAQMRRTGQFSADGLLAAQQAWLPNLLVEVAAFRRGEKPMRPVAAKASVAIPVPVPAAKTDASDDLLSDPAPAPKPAPADSGDLLTDAPAAAAPASSSAVAPRATHAPATLELDDAEARVAEGGWYRRDEAYTLFYRPGGHADQFLTAWLESTVADASPASQAIFNQLAADRAPGICMKCHSVDRTRTTAVVNWVAARPQPDQRPFTKFKHSAHFSLMGDQGCNTCHVLSASADYAGSFGANHNVTIFHSNFAPITKTSCAACHQPTIAGASCQQCHNYHTGELKKLRTQAAEFHGLAEPAHPPTEPRPAQRP